MYRIAHYKIVVLIKIDNERYVDKMEYCNNLTNRHFAEQGLENPIGKKS